MKGTIISSVFVLLGLFVSATGCSRAAVICEIVCECEHCSDQKKIQDCNALETAQDVAIAYECGDAWEAYTICVEERGMCDETESRFSVVTDAGEYLCEAETDALNECISESSAHNGTNGGID